MNVYAIRDALMQSAPIFYTAHNDEVARRHFAERCRDVRSPFYLNPSDYRVFRVATWDAEKMVFENEVQPVGIVTAEEVVAAYERSHLTESDGMNRTPHGLAEQGYKG